MYPQADDFLVSKFNCTAPWTNDSRYHICPIVDEKRYKSYAGMLRSSMVYANSKKDSCPKEPKCKRSDYKIHEAMSAGGQISELANKSTLLIQVQSCDVQQIVDSYSYSFSSFVGETGGALGLFLGISMLSIVEFIEYILRKIFSNK